MCAVLKLSPKWIPAKQNGHLVRAYRKQPITFVVPKIKTEASLLKNYENPSTWNSDDPAFQKWWHQNISEIKAIAWKEGKAAYEYRGRTYIFGQINNPDPSIASFAEQDGTDHAFLLNGKLVHSIDEINKRFTRNDVIKLGLISKEESIKRFNVNDAIISIETFDNNLITKNK